MKPSSSTVDQMIELRKTCTPVEIDKLGKALRILPRTIALAFICNENGKMLVDVGFDGKRTKNSTVSSAAA